MTSRLCHLVVQGTSSYAWASQMLGARCAVAVLALMVIPTSCASGPSCPPLAEPHPVMTVRALEEGGVAMTIRPPPSPTDPESDVCKVVPAAPQCASREPATPRCLPTDPNCGPEFDSHRGFWGWPVWHGSHGESGDKCYRANAQRYPYFRSNADACTYDGECRVSGCEACISYRRFPEGCYRNLMEVIVPPDAAPIQPQWCGCIEGRCTMFSQ